MILQYPGISCHVDWQIGTSVSEESTYQTTCHQYIHTNDSEKPIKLHGIGRQVPVFQSNLLILHGISRQVLVFQRNLLIKLHGTGRQVPVFQRNLLIILHGISIQVPVFSEEPIKLHGTGRQVPVSQRNLSFKLHDILSQQSVIFIFTTVRPINLKQMKKTKILCHKLCRTQIISLHV